MKPIVEKVLAGGLVDKSMVEFMEKMGMLPQGASDIVKEDALKGASREHLAAFAEDLATELEKEHKIRETALDLERIRWPAIVSIFGADGGMIVHEVAAVRDRMGRFYFRVDEVKEEWLTPGFIFERRVPNPDELGTMMPKRETILEFQYLYINDTPACWQVTVG